MASLLLSTAGVGAGIAVTGALVAGFIKENFPIRAATVMGVYATSLSLGSTVSAAATGPLATGTSGGWRTATAFWSCLGIVGMVAWILPRYRLRIAFGGIRLPQTPAVGAKAPDFTLSTPTGKAVTLSTAQSGDDLVLVILRGFPGYQCPYCVKQVHDFSDHASDFKAKNTRVLLVYPGPPADLDQHAKEFLEKQAELPHVNARVKLARSRPAVVGAAPNSRNIGAVQATTE